MAEIVPLNKTLEYGDLVVTMTSDWDWRYKDTGTGAHRAIDVYHARGQDYNTLRPLGSFAGSKYYNGLNGKQGTLLVGSVQGKSAVAEPVGYTLMWNDKKSKGDFDGAFWRPTAPNGYVALGDICTGSYNTPSLDQIWCVREDLVMGSEFRKSNIWDDAGSGATMFASVWAIESPIIGSAGSDKLPVLVDTFRLGPSDHYEIPPIGLAKVLALPCPNNFKQFDSKPPVFTKDTLPSQNDIFYEQPQAEVILPYTAFFKSDDRPSLGNIVNPFVSLSRRTAWQVYVKHVNDSAGTITDTKKITKGVSKTEAEEMSHSAGVEISASVGIKGFGASMSLNYQFSYKSSVSLTEYEEATREQGFTVPPYHATVFLTKQVWIKARRDDGSVTLHELGYNSDEDIHLVGIDLR
ncbi:hypothetical protein P3342_002718 [Pyrenophora teres f. teres]|uniref:DUF946 domain-containing protein n=1 Tax=Pyrenophora teres f. teres TaxID=97479 RepID=A0A6S6VV27_9PLEO|nr:hypothetical protein PTNB85_01352 [Pyrenophora teres f. teres]KAE8851032.1 hypothetical protein HRS9122_01319 [Pyrenophora teres f. teres]KAE8869705.1 hypothetical protein PTNB29_00049 [Pyrenophora teres f. teres]KAE8873418.1 hypothetical protein PTNB73_00050 [Pyrenophora teres f. teres]KAK1920421.1 hypothetical protein P3342_002718 [Pyrenophora teres f. teres]